MAGHGPRPGWRDTLERWLHPFALRRGGRLDERLAGAAKELYRTEAHKARVLDAVPDGICVSRGGRIVYGNLAMAKLVGISDPAEAIGRPTLDFVDAAFHEAVRQGRAAAADDVLLGPTEIRLKRTDGSRVPAELRVVAVDEGEGRSFLNVIRDLTAEKAAEAHAQLRATALEQSTDGVMIVNARGRVVYVNPAFCAMRHVESADLIGQPVREVFLNMGVEGGQFKSVFKTLLAGDVWRGRYSVTDERGEAHRDTRCFAVRDPEGEVHSFVALVRDINQEVELERRDEQARKLEAVGQLAGGLAHDVNNLLTLILGQVELLSLESPGDSLVQERTRVIGEAVERSASRVRQILAFGHRHSLDPRVIDVVPVVNDQRSLLAELVPGRITLEFDLSASLPPVRVDPGVIQQVLNELVLNARDAIEGEGTIRVAARSRDGGVELSVEDDGPGLDARTRARAFEPYFTTRRDGFGTGLGLATAHGLVTQSGGQLEIDSDAGHGARVRLQLPAAPTAPRPLVGDRDASQPESAADVHETLLVVEDEDQLRALARRTLSAAGYRILEAKDGVEALEVSGAHTGPIDLLVCDVILPGIDGVELAATLKRERPGLRVLLMSGYAPESTRPGVWSDLGALFLEKPFRMRDLRAFVRDALDSAPVGRSED